MSARIGRGPDQIVKLDANGESLRSAAGGPCGTGQMEFPHIYPDPESRAL
ncbi:hypothetical protein [Candidatus Villigracilis saccharophilus]|nr:hypothetical protein [Anaerolineales bacterium]